MREKPLVETVDVVIGQDGEERLVTVAKATADRWPDVYRPAETASGKPTAAAKRAADDTDEPPQDTKTAEVKPRRSRAKKPTASKDTGPKSPDDLPAAPNTSSAPAVADTTAGDTGVTTEGVTS
jgi:hypothetical protein